MLKTIASRFIRLPITKRTPFYSFSQNNNQHQNTQTNMAEQDWKTSQAIAKNVGMNQFLMRVYNTTGLSILGALGSSFMFMSMPVVLANLGAASLIGGIMTLGGFIGSSYMKPTDVVENVKGA